MPPSSRGVPHLLFFLTRHLLPPVAAAALPLLLWPWRSTPLPGTTYLLHSATERLMPALGCAMLGRYVLTIRGMMTSKLRPKLLRQLASMKAMQQQGVPAKCDRADGAHSMRTSHHRIFAGPLPDMLSTIVQLTLRALRKAHSPPAVRHLA